MRSSVRFPLALTAGLALLASRLFSLETENHHAVAYRISQPVVIDGELDELAWREASPVSSFTQREPREGESASEWTQVKVLFDDHSLYIGVICHENIRISFSAAPAKWASLSPYTRSIIVWDCKSWLKKMSRTAWERGDVFLKTFKAPEAPARTYAFPRNYQPGAYIL